LFAHTSFVPQSRYCARLFCFQYGDSTSSSCVLELSPARSLAQSRHSLVDYASCYWENARTRRAKTESATPLALRHPVGFGEHIPSKFHSPDYYQDIIYTWCRIHPGLSLKHFMEPHSAATPGMGEISPTLSVNEWDINASDTLGLTEDGRGRWGLPGKTRVCLMMLS